MTGSTHTNCDFPLLTKALLKPLLNMKHKYDEQVGTNLGQAQPIVVLRLKKISKVLLVPMYWG